jgi:6-pyruvoyl-tetrahydropterin synthase
MVITSSINVKIAKETEDNPNTVIDFAGIKTSIIIEISRPLATVLLNIPHPPHKYIRILLLPTRHFNGHSFPFSLNRTIKEKTLPRNADSTEMQRPTVMAVERRN